MHADQSLICDMKTAIMAAAPLLNPAGNRASWGDFCRSSRARKRRKRQKAGQPEEVMQSAAAEQLILLDYAGEIEQLFFQRRLLSDEIIGLAGRPSSGSVVLVDTRLPGREWIDLTLYDAKTLAAPFRLRIVRERGDLYLLLGRLAIKASENSANAAERMAAVIQQATQMGIRKIIQDAL